MRCTAFPPRGPFEEPPTATTKHMPFAGHRTLAQVRADEEEKEARRTILRSLGR
jgi:hypothetical protein